MAPREIKAALVSVGVRQADIARGAGKSPQLVNDVITGARRNEIIEAAIAVAIGKPVQDVFEPAPVPAAAPAS